MIGTALLVFESIIIYSTTAFFVSLYFWLKDKIEQNKINKQIFEFQIMKYLANSLGYSCYIVGPKRKCLLVKNLL